MPNELPHMLREYLQQEDQDLAAVANNLWRISRPIHERQNRPDSNENGFVHVQAVEDNIWRLLQTTTRLNKANNLEDFMPFELFLLSCAACCHDFDKALKSTLPEGFEHGKGSGDFVEKNMDKLGLTRPQANAISSVISIHNLNPDEFQQKLSQLRTNQASPVGSYNLQRLAVLLKAADILHCDNSRIPSLGIEPDNLEGLDRKKHLCRHCTEGWISDGTRIVIQASPRTEEEIEAVSESLGYMKNSEWPAVSGGLERYNFPYQLEMEQDVTMQGGLKQDEIDPLAPEMLPVPGMEGVLLGRYPVTVAEYNCFIENNGYRDPQYWEEEWWGVKEEQKWTVPEDWDEQIEHQNRPVTGVSWYEAGAYCKWLTARTNLSYRLSGEKEWKKAATNPNGEYPWGDAEPNPELLNFAGNVGVPTPVGIYPAGAAPGGHLDMSGNVWEWNRDLYEERGSVRVIGGGGWNSSAHYCRSAFRDFYPPGRLGRYLGFRLSRSISLGP